MPNSDEKDSAIDRFKRLLRGEAKEVYGPGLRATFGTLLWWKMWLPVLIILGTVAVADWVVA